MFDGRLAGSAQKRRQSQQRIQIPMAMASTVCVRVVRKSWEFCKLVVGIGPTTYNNLENLQILINLDLIHQ